MSILVFTTPSVKQLTLLRYGTCFPAHQKSRALLTTINEPQAASRVCRLRLFGRINGAIDMNHMSREKSPLTLTSPDCMAAMKAEEPDRLSRSKPMSSPAKCRVIDGVLWAALRDTTRL